MGFLDYFFAKEPRKNAPKKSRVVGAYYVEAFAAKDFVSVDVETTGLDVTKHEILEIAAVRYCNGIECGKFHSFVRPEGRIPRESTAIHGISWGRVAGKPFLSSIKDDFLRFLGDDVILAYNASFDLAFLQTRMEISIENSVFDVLGYVRRFVPEIDSYKLEQISRYFKISERAHSALGDARATAQVYLKVLESNYEDSLAHAEFLSMENMRLAQIQREWENERLEARKRKDNEKSLAPSRTEQNKLSKKMSGLNDDYIYKVKSILKSNNRDIDDLYKKSFFSGESLGVVIRSHMYHPTLATFFRVKTEGQLKYIALSLPVDRFVNKFPCAPTSMDEEGVQTRIFVASPDDLDILTDEILNSYDSAILRKEKFLAEEPKYSLL